MTDGYKIKRVLTWVNGVEKQIYPAVYKREPNASRTLLYLPLESDATDMSGNNRTTTANSVTYTTVGGVTSAHVGSGGGITVGGNFLSQSISKRTISCLVYWTSQYNSHRRSIVSTFGNTSNFAIIGLENTSYIRTWIGGAGIGLNSPDNIHPANQRFHIVCTCEDGANNNKIYINGELVAQGNGTSKPRGYSSDSGYYIMRTNTNYESLDGNMREMIWENVIWSAEDVSNYYNRIKDKLGF